MKRRLYYFNFSKLVSHIFVFLLSSLLFLTTTKKNHQKPHFHLVVVNSILDVEGRSAHHYQQEQDHQCLPYNQLDETVSLTNYYVPCTHSGILFFMATEFGRFKFDKLLA